jgi:16S rRNA (uracil1498-N3)-methyltransferase
MDLTNLRFPRFFINGEQTIITGNDAKHISTVLRMKKGEKAVLCSNDGFEYPAEIISAEQNRIEFKILAKRENDSEPELYIRLFQCVPKGEKLDLIVQKTTELGVSEIIPVISKRCVSRPDKKSNKTVRLQKIAEQAAKQSGREFTSFSDALKLYKRESLGIIFYENGGIRLNEIVKNKGSFTAADIFIGSEGGFEPAEIEAAKKAGLIPAGLGRLILRTETAPVAAISILMNLLGEI